MLASVMRPLDVRSGSFASILACPQHVRLRGNLGNTGCDLPLMAIHNRHSSCDKSTRRAASRVALAKPGKLLRITRSKSQAPNSKIFCFSETPNQRYHSRVSCPQEGRFAIVTDVGRGMRWTSWRQAIFSPDEIAKAYGQVVWSWRRDAGVKLAGSIPPATVTTSPLHRGEHEVSRKATRAGKAGLIWLNL